MSAALDFRIPSPLGSLDAYVEAVNTMPMLSLEQEQEFARRFQQHEDLEAARRLVVSHLRFVVKVARGYNGYGLAQGDLIQEGNIGLMKAVKRFDPDVGVRLVSFAVHWVRAEMHEFILRNWRIVKVATTKAQRKLFFNLRSQKKRLGWLNAEEITDIANTLNVSPSDILLMEERLNAHDAAFDGGAADSDEISSAPANYLSDTRFEPAALLESDQHSANNGATLTESLTQLDDRSRDIVVSRWLTEPKATLKELAKRYDVSAERIRQIEQQAFSELREQFDERPLLTSASSPVNV